MMRYKERAILLLLVLILTIPGFSFAAGEMQLGAQKGPGYLRWGPLDIHPYLSVKETYNDNIYFTADDKKYDFITAVMPGVSLKLPFRGHTISLDALTTVTSYASHFSENTTDYVLNGQANFMFGSRINLKLSDNYTKGHEDRGSSSTAKIEKFRSNAAAASLTYLLAEVSKVQVDYTRTAWNFKTSEFRSRDEDIMSFYLYYRMLPKTSAFMEYDFKNVSFKDKSNGLDNKVQSGLLGLSWELTERSKGTVKGGYLVKDFDLTSKDSLKTWTASVDINHEFSDYNAFRLVGARTANESSFLGTRYTITTGLYGEFTHRFLDRLAGVGRASYGIDKFSDAIPGDRILRKDRTASAGLGLRYLFRRWAEVDLDYDYRKRNSNINAYDYTVNSFMLSMSFVF